MKTFHLTWTSINNETVSFTIKASTLNVAHVKARRELNKTHANQIGSWSSRVSA